MTADDQPRRVRFQVRGANEDQCRRNAQQVARAWFGLDVVDPVQVELGHELQVISRDAGEGPRMAGFSVAVTATTTSSRPPQPPSRLVETEEEGVS